MQYLYQARENEFLRDFAPESWHPYRQFVQGSVMAISKETQLAQARRRLRRLEEDIAAFRMRAEDLPEAHRKPMQLWFREMVQEQRNAVRRLESVADPRGRERRSSAA